MSKGKTKQKSESGAPLATKPVAELDEAEATFELKRLASEIAQHDDLYYRKDAPEISDAEYDALRARNDEIEARFPKLVRDDSPSLKVGAAPVGAFGKVRHRVRMLAIDNAFSDEKVEGFLTSAKAFLGLSPDQPLEVSAEPKIDGLSITLRYER